MTDITPISPSSPAAPAAPAAAETTPARAVTFEVLPLSREVRETLAEIGYVSPTPVQIAVWEPATRGRDAVVQARTGTGKTAAFGLPIVDHLVRRSLSQVQTLALCPTRELALQVTSEIERLGKRKGVKVTAIYGGAPMQRQIDAIADGAQVVVGTPGRVLDHIRRGTLDLRHVRLLVLDEADEMLSMGFEREVTAILDALPKERQTLLFSATLPPDIERMAKKLNQPEYLTLSGDHIGALEIEHFVYLVSADKTTAMLRVIEVENPESAIVFCNTRDETERLAGALQRQGYDADWLNGDLPQSDREKVMAATREGRLRFLVCTDVAARGIDISHLTHVINFDFPQDSESYVHRTGRTGRAGRTGTAISLITPHDIGGLYLLRLTYKIRPLEKQIPSEGELKTRAEADLVTMLAEAFAARGVHNEDLALARRLLTHEQSDLIIAGLLRDHLGPRPDAQRKATAARKATRAPARPSVRSAAAPVAAAPVAAAPVAAAPVAAAPVAAAPAPAPAEPTPVAVSAPIAPLPAPAAAPTAEARPAAPPAPVGESAAAPAPAAEPPIEARAVATVSAPQEERRAEPPPREERGERRPRGGFEGREPRADGDRERGRGRGRDRDRDRDEPRRGEGRPPRRAPEDFTPVSAAAGSHEGDSSAVPTRHADFSTWQPPAEEGDDEPILGSGGRERRGDPGRWPRAAEAVSAPLPAPETRPVVEPVADADLAEIYVNVGRREGARASDFQRLLTEKAGIPRELVRRIRVRERNAFVSVRREDLAAALAALNGATIAGKAASAEQARERGEEERAPSGEDAGAGPQRAGEGAPVVEAEAPKPADG